MKVGMGRQPGRVRRRGGLQSLVLMASLLLALLGGDTARGQTEHDADQAQTSPSVPPYIQRGNEVEARYRAYRERLQAFHEALQARVRSVAPDLLPQVKAAAPKVVRHGYQLLPHLVADAPAPVQRLRATSAWYTWPWTEQLIARDLPKLEELEAQFSQSAALAPEAQRAVYETVLAAYRPLAVHQRTIDAHIHYNRLWQPLIARDQPAYDRQTALHDAVLERQAILDALSATDEAAFRKALSGIKGIDGAQTREAVESQLREREQGLAQKIHAATDVITPPSFLRVEHPTPHLWIVHVPFYTDIEDTEFVHAFQTAIERVWHVQDGEEEFRVQLTITSVSAAELYGQQTAPHQGEAIDLQAHAARFPPGGGVLTTGATSTHVLAGRCIALAPHDLAPHVLGHEFGHVLGLQDVYFRGYKDLGAEGYQVMEVVADPEDIMGNPGSGPVLRRHFARLIEKVSAAAAQ